MLRLGKPALILCLFLAMPAHAQSKGEASRGELLYSTYCNACHTSQIHWRDKKLVTGWSSLKAQVRRWQASAGLGWDEDEIDDVARYLNASYYGFSDAGQKSLREEKGPRQTLGKD